MSGIEDGLRLRLRLLDVRLVERVDAEDRAGDRRGQLEAKNSAPTIVRRRRGRRPRSAGRRRPRTRRPPARAPCPPCRSTRRGAARARARSRRDRRRRPCRVPPASPSRARARARGRITVGDAARVVHLLRARQQPRRRRHRPAPPGRARRRKARSSARRSSAPRRPRSRRARARASPAASPGSVMTRNDSALFRLRSQRWSKWQRVSTVVPDFDEMTKSASSISSRRSAAGCVVSSTSSGAPASRPITSGARLDPPIPQTTTRSRRCDSTRRSSSSVR